MRGELGESRGEGTTEAEIGADNDRVTHIRMWNIHTKHYKEEGRKKTRSAEAQHGKEEYDTDK